MCTASHRKNNSSSVFPREEQVDYGVIVGTMVGVYNYRKNKPGLCNHRQEKLVFEVIGIGKAVYEVTERRMAGH